MEGLDVRQVDHDGKPGVRAGAALGLVVARARWSIGVAGWCFIAAFALIAIAFSLNGDAALMVNFAFLLVFIPLVSWFSRYAAPDSAIVVSWVAFVGTLLSAVTALSDIYFYKAKRAEGWWSDPIWAAEAARTGAPA